jgi:Cytochrome b(C-terminal)/b6/petD
VQGFYDLFNALAAPAIFISLATLVFVLLIWKMRFITRPAVMGTIAALTAGFFVIGAQNHDFKLILTKGDNMPIVIMIFSIMGCLYLGLRQACVNDMRIERGEPPMEAADANKKVLVWPDLVFPEFIATVVLSAVFIFWGILVEAPLEEPASGTRAPNPAKAPWYFLGLQEMLVYYDPWYAGVILPTFILLGLMVIPYIDTNPRGNGYYTYKERPFAISMFLFGFLVLWVTLVILGTFLRGPNWNFFGPFEYWDPHKVEPLVNVNLSEYFWAKWFHTRLPDNPLIRELPGLLFFGGYLVLLPGILAKTVLKKFFNELGFARYSIMVMLLLFMGTLPLKMLLRWFFNLKYFIAMPEYFFNI